MATETIHTTTLETLECCKCGMPLGLSDTWVKHARAIGEFRQQFYCPYCGYQQGWGRSQHAQEVARLKAECARLEQSRKWTEDARDNARAEAEHFRRSRDGIKGALSKVKKRIGRGVCPCCNRHFANVERHMHSKHPEVSAGAVDVTPTA